MKIAFACPHCQTRYEVDARLAGRKAKCRNCKGAMLVPLRSNVESSARTPVGAVVGSGEPSPDQMFPTNIGLAPLDDEVTHEDGRAAQKAKERKLSYNPALDAPSSAALPQLVPTDIALPKLRQQGGGKPPNAAVVLWRKVIGGQIKILRSISDFAYLLTVPLILAFIIGVLMRREVLAYPAALAIVLLNLGRLILDGIAMYALPFKNGIGQGLMFLIPPFTFVYLAQNWRKMRKAVMRFLGPALPILLVLLAFIFIPWLSSGGEDDRLEGLRERVSAAESAVGVEPSKIQDLGQRARAGVEKAREAVEAKKDSLRGRP